MDRSKKGRSARWGAACAPCASAKTRCIRSQPWGEQCDRCQSLEKDCVGQSRGPRKKRQVKPSTNLDTETALPRESFSHLVYSSQTPGAASSTVHASSSNGSLDHLANVHSASSASTEPQARVTTSRDETLLNALGQDSTSRASVGVTCTCMAIVDVHDLAPVESDDTLLSIYKNLLSNAFPFVIVPASTDPEQLQVTRPFLMKVIRMVASIRHLKSMRGQSQAIMEHISNAMFMRSERSMDLLQGILVFLGFYHNHCMAHAHFNNLIRLAISLVEDLDLSTCPKAQQRRSQLPLVRAEEPVSRTNDEKRALLGVWYMSSNAGLVVKQLASTRYTTYMDRCLEDLSNAREYKTDQIAVHLVRIQKLTEKIFYFHSSDSPTEQLLASPQPPTMARMEAFQSELDSLRSSISLGFESNYFLSCYHNSAYLRIFEPLLTGSHLPDTESRSFAALSLSGVQIFDVFSHFTAALNAWVEHWLAIPVCSYFYMSQPAYVQLVHGAMMLSRWVRLAGPNSIKLFGARTTISQKEVTDPLHPLPSLSGVPSCPDLSLPRPPSSQSTQLMSAQIMASLRAEVTAQSSLQIDILGILDTMAARFEAAKKEMVAAQGVEWENDTWDFAAAHSKMKKARIEKWCEMVYMAAGEGRTPLADVQDSNNAGSTEPIDIMAGQSVDDFGWATPSYDWDNIQWESALFDEILQDIHT